MPTSRPGRLAPGPVTHDPTVAVGVVGFGRCGSSMMMQMLAAGGLAPAGEVSPRSMELAGGLDAAHVPGLDLRGRAVKLLDSARIYGLPAGDPPVMVWRFVWLDRDPAQQARSHVKFLAAVAPEAFAALGRPSWQAFAASYSRDRSTTLSLYRAAGHVLVMRYERVLLHPAAAARKIARHIWPGLDVDAAAAVVHLRDGRCRPDLAVEAGVILGSTGAV